MAALLATGALAFAGVQSAHAGTVVATIVGAYDFHSYDTPELDFSNTSGGTFTNVSMFLKGYQGLNNGVTQTVPLANMGPGATNVIWGTSGPLFANDYDDSKGNDPPGYTNPLCVVNASLCSLVGNFQVTFTAKISGGPFNGDPVFAQFSPTTNFTGGFVGWEGLDPSGLSETTFDQHSGSFSGTMAQVVIGTPPPPVPEPSTWAMMMLGFAGLGYAGYRRAKRPPLAAA
jgi:hypothetical protein